MKLNPARFQTLLLTWFDENGRKSLPWQINKTPYRVWISEIMLQQTQVSTVIPYFNRFMERFPDLPSLAKAHEDDVLLHWAGLGYYSRARNLHRAAMMILQDYQGKFPNTQDTLQTLPGIGQSTAGAILSIAFQRPTPILDGNVKRVLTRLHGITDPINDKATESRLWELAASYTPTKRIADYTQAIMDLGATLCTRSKPACGTCPFGKQCIAYRDDLTTSIPAKKAARQIPTKSAAFLILKKGKHIFLRKRPSTGIWGGLFSLPELPGNPTLTAIKRYCQQHFQIAVTSLETLTPFRHTFSHYHLLISPIVLEIKKAPLKVMEENKEIWYNLKNPEPVGLPKPVQSIIRGLA